MAQSNSNLCAFLLFRSRPLDRSIVLTIQTLLDDDIAQQRVARGEHARQRLAARKLVRRSR
jgi:hypothetical protein